MPPRRTTAASKSEASAKELSTSARTRQTRSSHPAPSTTRCSRASRSVSEVSNTQSESDSEPSSTPETYKTGRVNKAMTSRARVESSDSDDEADMTAVAAALGEDNAGPSSDGEDDDHLANSLNSCRSTAIPDESNAEADDTADGTVIEHHPGGDVSLVSQSSFSTPKNSPFLAKSSKGIAAGYSQSNAGTPTSTPSASLEPDFIPSLATPALSDRIAMTPSSFLATPGTIAPKGPERRLVIQKMVLRDFKSYAGEQVIGPFHKSFSSVVGPNGSGKSNVIDAMLFVFGFKANKMRQGKLSELIHNSSGKQSIGSCSVEVWFREIYDKPGRDAFEVVRGSQIIVARTAYRNNTSQYTLNSRKSTFTEVTTLLKGRGIDLDHKRFLILQGEVESIAQMPPKAKGEHDEGLLEYLEDIIGTSAYKTPIAEALKACDELNEERSTKLGRLKIVQKEKELLEAKKRESEAYLADQNELTRRQSALWQVMQLECRDQMQVASQSMEKLRVQIESETDQHTGSKAEIEALEKEFKQMEEEFAVVAKETEIIIKEMAKLEKEDVQLQERRKHIESKKKKVSKAIADDKHGLAQTRTISINAGEEIKKVKGEMTTLQTSLEAEDARLDDIRDSLKDKTKDFNAAIEVKQRDLQPWVAKLNEKTAERDVAAEERNIIVGRAGQAVKDMEEASEALQALVTDNESKREDLSTLRDEKKTVIAALEADEAKLKDLQHDEDVLQAAAAAARSRLDEARSSASANQSRGDVLTHLGRQAELGILKGFYGRLGSLGVIDDKYDIAISTACPGLNNIVVESVETGQACIEHLRKNNLGRANFILLNSIGKGQDLGPISTPDNVPRLFDLVRPKEPRFAVAFYHQLRNTLVVQDLAHANKVAFRGNERWRVVTLDGQLIDTSGTMSGGGIKASRGGMSSAFSAEEVSPRKLAEMEKECDSAELQLQQHRASICELEKRLDADRTRMPQIDVEIDMLTMDLNSGEKRVEEARRLVSLMEESNRPDATDAARLQEVDQHLQACEAEIAKIKSKTSAIEAEIQALQDQILQVGGVRLRSQQSKVNGIKEMVELCHERVTKAEVTKAKADKDISKLEASVNGGNETLLAHEEELATLNKEIKVKLSAVDSVRSQVQQAQEVMESKQEDKDEIKIQLDEKSEEINAFRSRQMEIKQKLEDSERIYAENDKRYQKLADRRAQLELHDIDDDDDEDDDEDEEENEAAARKAGDNAAISERTSDPSAAQNPRRKSDQASSGALDLEEYSIDELRAIDKEATAAEIITYEEKIEKGTINLSVLAEFRKREADFLARAADLDTTTSARDGAKKRYDDLRKLRLESFMAGFNVISSKLKEMYQTITLGGNAELELVDSLDPFSEGIIFSVMPPKKSWKNICNLSGGEKTLSSLALVFALHIYKPTPLYVMDEIDAALDFRNVSIVANLIKERTKNAQFIIISLRNNMFELSSRLVGIYKTNSMTKSITIDNSDMHAIAVQAPGTGMRAPTTSSRTGGSDARLTARTPSVSSVSSRSSQVSGQSASYRSSSSSSSSSILALPAAKAKMLFPVVPRTATRPTPSLPRFLTPSKAADRIMKTPMPSARPKASQTLVEEEDDEEEDSMDTASPSATPLAIRTNSQVPPLIIGS